MERILITGATGFVGRHLIPQLLADGRHVTLAVRAAARVPAAWRTAANLALVETGERDSSLNLAEALADVTAVVHMARFAHVRSSQDGEAPFTKANADATAKLARAAAATGRVRTFVHLSSLAAITANASGTTVDDSTDDPPPTAYGRSKRQAEGHVSSLAAQGIFAVSLRPPLIVGPDARANWAALQRLAATGLPLPFAGVRNRRSLVSVETVVRAIVHLCGREWPAGLSGNYALADVGALSLPEIVTELRAGMGLPSRLVPCPPALLSGAASLVGQGHRAAGLLGSLEVDASRFRDTFGFPTSSAHGAIRASGRAFLQQRRARP